MGQALCARCGRKPRGTHVSYCRECWNAYQNEYRRQRYASDPAYREKMRSRSRERRYGISEDHIAELFAKQNGLCAICVAPPGKRTLHIDHDHKTGAIRGLLCHACNTAIGAFREDRSLMLAAIDYLAQYDN